MIALATCGLTVAHDVTDEVVAAVHSAWLDFLATKDTRLLNDFRELVQGQQERQMALLLGLVAILVVNGFRLTNAASVRNALVFAMRHVTPTPG